jgi:hypothetical protein
MHTINQAFLKLALLPSGFYARMGVDIFQLKAILRTKLLLDDRRPHPITQTRQTKIKKPVSKATLATMFMSLVMGALFISCFFISTDAVTQLTLYFSLFFVLLSLTLITDFTSVLIDIRDNFILLPKPVSDKTIVVARLLHIFIHLCKIVLPMSLPAFFYLCFNAGIFQGTLLLLMTFLLSGFAIFFINAVYIAILRFTTPQRFQAIITYLQIVFAIVMYGSYMLFPRLLSNFENGEFNINSLRGIVYYPLFWFATAWKVLSQLGGSSTEILLAIGGLLFPFVCMLVVVKYLAPTFNRKLSLLSASDSQPKKAVKTKTEKSTLSGFFSRFVTSGPVEKAGFVFTWQMMGRSREFKMKVYPTIGYLLVYAVYIFFSNRNINFAELITDNATGKRTLLLSLYFSVLILTMATSQLVYSDKYKASWIFHTSPIAKPGHILSGALKAVLIAFYFPIAILISVVLLFFGGASVVPNLLFALSNVTLIATAIMYTGKHYFPFSAAQSTNAKTGSFLTTLFVMLMASVLAGLHFLIYSILPAVILCLLLSFVALWYLFDGLKNISWQKVLSTYNED